MLMSSGSDYGGCVENVYDAYVMALNSVPVGGSCACLEAYVSELLLTVALLAAVHAYSHVPVPCQIQITLVAFTITVWLYNIFCIYVTFLLNSIWHAILDNFRPVTRTATSTQMGSTMRPCVMLRVFTCMLMVVAVVFHACLGVRMDH